MPTPHQFQVTDDTQVTILAAMRSHLPDKPSWSAVRKLLQGRFVSIGGVLCIDEARRLRAGEIVAIADHPIPPPPTDTDVLVRYVDQQVVIVEKPSGMVTLRRTSDLNWSWARKNQQPTLDECVPRLIGEHAAKRHQTETNTQRLPKLYSVHRIDRDSSGLLVFARNEESQKRIIQQFAEHKAVRRYFALVPGVMADQSVCSQFIRDRGDGLRGSTTDMTIGQHAVTHFRTLRKIGAFSELECLLETGRTNQIRIHLAELGHPICGDIKYRGGFDQPVVEDTSQVHRLALHAAELKFQHPITNQPLHFETPWPPDMQRYLNRLQSGGLQSPR